MNKLLCSTILETKSLYFQLANIRNLFIEKIILPICIQITVLHPFGFIDEEMTTYILLWDNSAFYLDKDQVCHDFSYKIIQCYILGHDSWAILIKTPTILGLAKKRFRSHFRNWVTRRSFLEAIVNPKIRNCEIQNIYKWVSFLHR